MSILALRGSKSTLCAGFRQPRGTQLTRAAQGEITKDAIYIDAERRFEELEKETKKLHEESKK
jgi:hypothetical protein